MKKLLLLALLLGCDPADSSPPDNQPADPGMLAILAWNIESGGSDPDRIARQLQALGGYDIYALNEVSPNDFALFAGVFEGFDSVTSQTGRGDRLQILFDGERFELLRRQELDRYREYILNNGTHRSPLNVVLRNRATGTVFQVMTNHLARSNEDLRTQQAIGLREWARDQTLPTINIGDFNMDYDFPTEQGNQAFVEMLRDNVWLWVKPERFIDTNWADSDGDGRDNYPHSMLDFAFVAGPARDWNPVCRVIVRKGDFPDDERESDHRPISLALRVAD